jgi:hypothetical protein
VKCLALAGCIVYHSASPGDSDVMILAEMKEKAAKILLHVITRLGKHLSYGC